MFDLAACELGSGSPPVTDRVAIVSAATAATLATKIEATLPPKSHVELDSAMMATLVELRMPGKHTAAQLAPDILAFVRAHACMFGVVDPGALAAHATGPQHEGTWVLIELKPRSIGAIQAEVDGDRVRIHGHLWPIADVTPAIDPDRMLARYLGRATKLATGTHYLVDPKTHRHLGCVPIVHDIVTDASRFSWRAGPILLCGKHSAEVHAGAYVWLPGQRMRADATLDELPTALDPAGNHFGRFIAPALRAPDDDELAYDAGTCP